MKTFRLASMSWRFNISRRVMVFLAQRHKDMCMCYICHAMFGNVQNRHFTPGGE